MTIEIKMDEKGRILIPIEIRNQLNLKPGEKLNFKIEEGNLVILKPSSLEDFMKEVENFQEHLKKATDKPISTEKLF